METIFTLPIVNGSVKLAGKGSEILQSNRIRQDIEVREEYRSDLKGATDEPNSAEQQREQNELEATLDFQSKTGIFIVRHHVQERQKWFVPQESSLPIPINNTDVVRRTHYIGRIARLSD